MKLFVWFCNTCQRVVAYPHGSELLPYPNTPNRNKPACSNECCPNVLGTVDWVGIYVKEGS